MKDDKKMPTIMQTLAFHAILLTSKYKNQYRTKAQEVVDDVEYGECLTMYQGVFALGEQTS